MARHRIGNDITIVWTVNDGNGNPLPLSDKEVHLFYTCERGRHEAEITIRDTNTVVWDFYGGLQKTLGAYSLTLEILQSEGKRSIRKDVCGAFVLVGKDCEADAKETTVNGEIAVYQEMITTNLDIARISPIIPVIVEDENGVGYWYVDGVNTGERATGESAYDYAVSKGYEGTEEEYAELLAAVGENISDLKGIQNQIDELSNKIVPSDWWAENKNEAGYIKNRTHYVMGKVVTTLGFYDCPTRKILFQGNVVELPEDGTVITLVNYANKLFVRYVKGPQKIAVFNENGETGESVLLQAFPIKIISEIVPLSDVYIPETIARKSEVPTKLSQLEQDIEIGGEDSDFYIIESFNLIWLYKTYVWADGDKNDIADIQFKTDEGPAIWDAIRAGKKIAVKMGDDTVHGYGLAITAYTDDVSYLTFQYEDVGCFYLGIDGRGDVGGYFYRSVTANNLETFLAKSPKLAELSLQVGKVSDAVAEKVNATYVDNAIASAITNELNSDF